MASRNKYSPQPACSTAPTVERIASESPCTIHAISFVVNTVCQTVEMAVFRLRTTKESIEQIATAVGYGDGVTLRMLLRKKTGRGIRELRAQPGS